MNDVDKLKKLLGSYNNGGLPYPTPNPDSFPIEDMFDNSPIVEPEMSVPSEEITQPAAIPTMKAPMVIPQPKDEDLSVFESDMEKMNRAPAQEDSLLEDNKKGGIMDFLFPDNKDSMGNARIQDLVGNSIKALNDRKREDYKAQAYRDAGRIINVDNIAQSDSKSNKMKELLAKNEELRKEKEKKEAQDKILAQKKEESDRNFELKERELDIKAKALRSKSSGASGGTPKPTEGQKSLDRQMAKDYSEYVTKGRQEVVGAINNLESAFSDIDKKWIQNETGRKSLALLGGSGKTAALQMFAPELKALKDRVESIIQKDLRKTLGAQFTENEGKMFLERGFDPSLPIEEVKKNISQFLESASREVQAKDSLYKHFEDNNFSSRGYQGLPSEQPQQKPDMTPQQSTEGKVRIVAPNGSVKLIPSDKVQEALASGGKLL